MKSKKQIVLSVLSVVFYVLVFLSPFIAKGIFTTLGYSGESIPIAVIVMMVCAVILGAVTVINKERVVTIISIVTCTAGVVCMLIFGSNILSVRSVRLYWLLSGYLLLLLLVLAPILGKVAGKQKAFQIVRKVIAVLLFVNVVANILRAATETYGIMFGIIWELIYFEIALVINSLASVFWGMWLMTRSKCSDK